MDFDGRAEVYNKYRKADYRLVNRIVELLSLKKGAVIADVGAGTGNYSVAIKNKGYHVIAIEPSLQMIGSCLDTSMVFINSPAEHITLEDNSVDGTIIINAIHHFKDLECAFSEINRISKPGSLLILTFDPKICRKIWLYDYWSYLKAYIDECYMDIELLKDLLSKTYKTDVEEIVFNIPIDFLDTFSSAVWGRPYFVLDK